MLLSILSSSWLVAQKYRQGLWEQCIEEGAPEPLPFGLEVHSTVLHIPHAALRRGCGIAPTCGSSRFPVFQMDLQRALTSALFSQVGPGCYAARNVAYVQAAAALCVITLLCDIAATLMTGFGLCSRNPVRKYMLYRLAFYVMVCAREYERRLHRINDCNRRTVELHSILKESLTDGCTKRSKMFFLPPQCFAS